MDVIRPRGYLLIYGEGVRRILEVKSECVACGEIFNSVSTFDKHRVGEFGDPIYSETKTGKRGDLAGYTPHTRRCLTVDEMLAKGWCKNVRGWWITSAYDPAAHQSEETSDELEEQTEEVGVE